MTKGRGVLPIGAGLAIGIAIGVAMHQIGAGIAIGVALGSGSWLFTRRPKPPEAKEGK